MKRRPMTEAEQHRVYRLCYDSKLGKNNQTADDYKYIQAMFQMDPKGYAEVSDKAASQAFDDYTAPYRALAAAEGGKGGA